MMIYELMWYIGPRTASRSGSRKSIIKLGTKYNPKYVQMTVKDDDSETSTVQL